MKSSFSFTVGVLSIISILTACQGAPPVISAVEWDLYRIMNPLDGKIHERLSLFVRAEDDDGEDDLEELYLSHPGARLYWTLRADEWEKRSRSGSTWLGSSRIDFPGGLPRGEYRVKLIDRAGEETEESFYIDLPEGLDGEIETFPLLEKSGQGFLVRKTADNQIRLVGEDSEGRVVLTIVFNADRLSEEELGTEQQQVASWYLFSRQDSAGWISGSGPYRF